MSSLEPLSSAPAGDVGDGYWAAPEETAARLEAMSMAAADLVDYELSEEQFLANSQIQEDELLALQAIYGDDMVILDNINGLRAFQISLRYQLEGDIQVYMNVACPNNGTKDDEEETTNDGLLYACSLEHLPPITLTCTLPRSYPSTRAPSFVVASKWLDQAEVSAFCSALDDIWAEQPGQEVVYRWADWLSGSSWSSVIDDSSDVDDQHQMVLVLGPDAAAAAGTSVGCSTAGCSDERAIGRRLILDSTIPLMRRYSEERSRAVFEQSIHECGVCLSENTGRNFARLPCGHAFCARCMETYCALHVREGSCVGVTALACPDTSCRAPLPPAVLRRLLDNNNNNDDKNGTGLYERWEALALRRALDTMDDVAYCPRCNAACVAWDDGGCDAQCGACLFAFCARCLQRRHVGLDCVPAEDKVEQLLMEAEAAASAGAAERSSEEARRVEQRRVEELLSLREVLRTTRQCPSCRMAIAKTQGCNKMVCASCGAFLCYRCGRAIRGYDHFVSGECGLFDRVGRRRLDDDDEFEEPGWIRAIRYTCPTCGVKRPKTGKNNLLVCRGCQTRYCALCWKRVWDVSHHYGHSGDCQQRS